MSIKANKINIITGSILIALGILCNPWLVGFIAPDKKLSFATGFFLFLFDIGLIILGLAFIKVINTQGGHKKIIRGIALVIACIIALELTLRLLTLIVPLPREQTSLEERKKLSPYQSTDWGDDYWEEFYKLKTVYEPIRGWKREIFNGKYINIDSNGVRKTWNSGALPDNAPDLYMFGGSALWGTGARDEYTIASYVSKLLDKHNRKIRVTNFGESGYTFLQEVIYLQLLLHKGARPEYVVFYDGFNDVYNAYQSGTPETTQNADLLRSESKSISPLQHIGKGFIGLARNTTVFKVTESAENAVKKWRNPQSQFQETASQYSKEQILELAPKIANDYKQTYALLDILSRAYNFKYNTFWQPTVYEKQNVSEEEQNSDPRFGDGRLKLMNSQVKSHIQSAGLPNFQNASDSLFGVQGTVFIDVVHLTEKGNELMVQYMFEAMKQNLL